MTAYATGVWARAAHLLTVALQYARHVMENVALLGIYLVFVQQRLIIMHSVQVMTFAAAVHAHAAVDYIIFYTSTTNV